MSERNGTADPFQLSGTTIAGKYSVGQVVGSGGFGVVYRGLHEGFGEPIAIKCLHVAEHLNASQRGDLLDRLQDEGRVLHRLSKLTAGIVQALDVGAVAAPSGQWVPYLVLEWIEGETLAEHMEARGARNEKGMGLHDAVELLEPAARALAIAHRQKVAHRDVKPENLCLTEVSGQRTVKILDFGIAKVLASHTEFTAAPAATERRTSVFTPRYGAPEQFNKKRGATGPWTDVFALALILVEVASGRRALDGDDATQRYIAAADPASRPTLRDRGVETTDAVEAVLARAMAVEPADRYADAGSFWDALCEAAFAEAEPAPVPEPADVSDTGEFVARHDLEIDGEPASATARREAAAAAATAGGAAAAVAIARADAADADALARASADDLADAVADAVADADAGTARAQRDAGAAHGRTAETPTEVEPAPGSTGPRPARWPLLLAVAAVGAAALLYVWSRPTAPDAAEPAAGTGRPEAAASGTTAGRARSGLVPTPPGSNLLADGPPTASATVPLPARDAGSPDGAASDAATASATAGPALAPVPPPGMVFVPGGADAGPSTGFFIDRTEVSTGDYRACVRAGRCPPAHRLVITEELAAALSGGGAREGAAATPEQLERAWEGRCNETREALDHPINCVNHPSAEDYCRFVRRRLPTSAEWTRAAAGAEGRRFPWGAEPPQCNRSCYGLNASCLGRFEQVATCAVGTHPRDCTPEGALDLGGNVSEWVADVFPAPGGPSGPARRLVRGGSFVEEASGLETGALNRFSPVSAHVTIGFRCALDAPAPAAPAAGTRR